MRTELGPKHFQSRMAIWIPQVGYFTLQGELLLLGLEFKSVPASDGNVITNISVLTIMLMVTVNLTALEVHFNLLYHLDHVLVWSVSNIYNYPFWNT